MAHVASIVAGVGVVGLVVVLLTWDKWANTQQPTVTAAAPKEAEKYAMDWEAKAEPVAFDAKRAMGYLKDICDIGPRISGTDGMKKQQELLEKHFEDLGGKVTYRSSPPSSAASAEDVDMANLIVSWNPDAKRRVILCSHYDTRPIADQEPNRGNWQQAVRQRQRRRLRRRPADGTGPPHEGPARRTSASISSSSTARNTSSSRNDEYFFGSKHFARGLSQDAQADEVVYLGAVLLDMIAGKNADVPGRAELDLEGGRAGQGPVDDVAADLKCPRLSSGRVEQVRRRGRSHRR